jgi:hypothetical protein
MCLYRQSGSKHRAKNSVSKLNTHETQNYSRLCYETWSFTLREKHIFVVLEDILITLLVYESFHCGPNLFQYFTQAHYTICFFGVSILITGG